MSLKIGAADQQVEVTADQLAVETQDSGSAGTITSKQVENLTLNGRNFPSMGQLIPGVSSTAGNNQQSAGGLTGGTTLIVNGASIEYSVYTLDGVYNMNTGNLANINILPIIDSIDEFRILKDNYSARYGLAGSGQVVVQTKSGTNTSHGSAWDYFRNDALDANPYFATVKTKLRQNILSYSFGCPVMFPHVYNSDRAHKTFLSLRMSGDASRPVRRRKVLSSPQLSKPAHSPIRHPSASKRHSGRHSSPLEARPTASRVPTRSIRPASIRTPSRC